jgi:hypothetical protein
MIEVTHGPCLIDNNIFLSVNTFENAAQGTAFVHNLIGGNVWQVDVLDRETPYHFPHSTQVKGITKVLSGDDRVLNNMILGIHKSLDSDFQAWCSAYDRQVTPEIFYEKMKTKSCLVINPTLPVWIDGNAYAGFGSAFREEKNFIRVDKIKVSLEENNGEWILSMNIPEELLFASCEGVTTKRLGSPIFTEESYENPDETPVDFSLDIVGAQREGQIIPGPFAMLTTGEHKIIVWKINS